MPRTVGSKPARQGGPRQSGVPKVKMGPMKGNKGAKKVG
jgi:hypothetical protein